MPRVAPLMLGAMASQALLVVLGPTIVAIAADTHSSVGAVGQARSVTAAVAIVVSIAIVRRVDRVGVRRLLVTGAVIALVACIAVALAPTLVAFLAAHLLVGAAFACLLSAGFAGVAAFPAGRRARAIGQVAGANALAWIVVTPVAGIVTDAVSWRAAEAVPAIVALVALVTARSAASATTAHAGGRHRAVFRAGSLRRWIGAEVIAYAGWSALLTFVGAFFVERLGVSEADVGWLLAVGAGAFFVASTHSAAVMERFERRRLIAAAALAMGALLVGEFRLADPAAAVAGFALIGLVAGIRTPASGALGLAQLPEQPGAAMAARTAATQLGYLAGAVVGGAVIATAGYAALGVVLAAAMAASAVLIMRVCPSAESSMRARAPRGGDVVRVTGPC